MAESIPQQPRPSNPQFNYGPEETGRSLRDQLLEEHPLAQDFLTFLGEQTPYTEADELQQAVLQPNLAVAFVRQQYRLMPEQFRRFWQRDMPTDQVQPHLVTISRRLGLGQPPELQPRALSLRRYEEYLLTMRTYANEPFHYNRFPEIRGVYVIGSELRAAQCRPEARAFDMVQAAFGFALKDMTDTQKRLPKEFYDELFWRKQHGLR
jgi:hypothetical protein